MIAFLFPGQGVQQKNMLSLLKETSPETDRIFEAASDATGRDVKALCASDDLALLAETKNTQPAITAMNCAFFTALKERGVVPDVVAGHSLGQYSALICAEVLSPFDGFRLVARRAELMGSVRKKGKLCAVVGLDERTTEDVCSITGCYPALYNAPGQIVIGGEEKKVLSAADKAREAGAVKAEILSVENAFHTPCMSEMEEAFEKEVDMADLKTPAIKVLLNCKGGPAESLSDIRDDLIKQCCHPVLWADCMKYLAAQNPDEVYEVGVGAVLGGLLRRQNRKIIVRHPFTEE